MLTYNEDSITCRLTCCGEGKILEYRKTNIETQGRCQFDAFLVSIGLIIFYLLACHDSYPF